MVPTIMTYVRSDSLVWIYPNKSARELSLNSTDGFPSPNARSPAFYVVCDKTTTLNCLRDSYEEKSHWVLAQRSSETTESNPSLNSPAYHRRWSSNKTVKDIAEGKVDFPETRDCWQAQRYGVLEYFDPYINPKNFFHLFRQSLRWGRLKTLHFHPWI